MPVCTSGYVTDERVYVVSEKIQLKWNGRALGGEMIKTYKDQPCNLDNMDMSILLTDVVRWTGYGFIATRSDFSNITGGHTCLYSYPDAQYQSVERTGQPCRGCKILST